MTRSAKRRRGIARRSRALLGGLCAAMLFAQCTTVQEMRDNSARAYFNGDVELAALWLDKAARSESGLDPDEATGDLEIATWDMNGEDTPLIAMERALLYLRQGDPDSADRLLYRCADVLAERRVDSFLEYIGVQGLDSVDALLQGDGELDYQPAAYEELMAAAFTLLASYLSDAPETKPLTEACLRVQEGILELDPNASHAELMPEVGEMHQQLACTYYIAGSFFEALGDQGNARRVYNQAYAMAPIPFFKAAVDRVKEGAAPPTPDTAVVEVYYLVGRGPKMASSRFRPQEITPEERLIMEAAVRSATAVVGFLSNYEDYSSREFINQNFSQAPIPIPFLEPDLDRQIPPLNPLRVLAGEGQLVTGGNPATAIADFHAIAEINRRALLAMRLTRVVLRRVIKEAGLQQIENDLARFFARLGLTWLEDADIRAWANLPAELQVARLEVPADPGDLSGTEYQLDLGVPRLGPQRIRCFPGQMTCVLVFAPGGGSPPSALVDSRSRVARQPEPAAAPEVEADSLETAGAQ